MVLPHLILAGSSLEESLAGTMRQLVQGGSWWMVFGIAFLGGLLTALTPCVYPLIPITVRYFGGMTGRALPRALIYVAGMVALYASLGTGIAASGGVFGTFLANGWVVGGIALFCAAMGASMLGLFTLQLPPSLQTKLSQAGGQGPGGAFVMGLVSGIIAAPCTGPVLGVILTLIASTGEIALGFGLMVAFGLGLGVPFLGLALSSGAVQKLPKGGAWMEAVKVVLAVPMFVVALYFLRFAWGDLRSGLEAVRAGVPIGLLLLVIGITAIVLFLRAGGVGAALKTTGVVAVTAALTLLLFGGGELAAGEDGASGDAGFIGRLLGHSGEERSIRWLTRHDPGLEQARAEKRPVMIDFTADWCVACKELDRETYVDAAVLKEAERFVSLKLDATEPDDEMDRLFEKYRIRGLPTVIFLDSSGKELDDLRVTGFVPPDRFAAMMSRVK